MKRRLQVKKQKAWVKKVSVITAILFFMAGCATTPANIKPAYVSPLKYSNYNCEQIQQEYNRLNQKLTELTQKQEKSANIDAAAMGIGMILFWPALFFLIGGDHETELAQLKGDYEAIEMIAIGNKCSFAPEIQADREKRIEEAEKLKKSIQERGW